MSSLKVAVRVRPISQREINMDSQVIVRIEGKRTCLLKPKKQSIRDGRENYHDFTFDYSYWSCDKNDSNFASQEQVYNDLGKDVIDCAFQGYNACIFAYGQTGSGKTFTMMGTKDNPGLIPRICQELFARIRLGQESGTGYKTHASYLEIYNEKVRDLLCGQSLSKGLRVREHPNYGSYVEDLSQHSVSNFEEIHNCLIQGNVQRTTATTNMNDSSSRSHSIFTVTFVQAVFMNDMPSETVSKIHLVDLAGSERANASGATGQRLKEGAHINKSLVTLGNVISTLAENSSICNASSLSKASTYVPYRNSILTWLLKDSLGGNSKTIMIAALSPAEVNYNETLSTLRYANRAKNIINKPTINEDANVKLIRELREEINKLKSMLTEDVYSQQPSLKIVEDIQKKEAQEKVLTEEWTEKWKEAQIILQEQKSLGLRKSGIGGVVLDSEMPHLIAIHNDVTTGVTLYSLKDGETLIGNSNSKRLQDIELTGDDICAEHCSIHLNNSTGTVILYPRPSAQCFVNGCLIENPTTIKQGDIILLGSRRSIVFRFNHPAEAAKLRKDLSCSQINMSRLSLLTFSRENLLNSSFHWDDEFGYQNRTLCQKNADLLCSSRSSEFGLQEENCKMLETIDNALKQLNTERMHIQSHYKIKIENISEKVKRLEKEEMGSLPLLNYRARELLARKEMYLWEKLNGKLQVDIFVRQISALQVQLDLKKDELMDCIIKEVKNDFVIDKLEEIQRNSVNYTLLCNEILGMTSSFAGDRAHFLKSLVENTRDTFMELQNRILQKENVFELATVRVAALDESILDIDTELEKLEIELQNATKQQRETKCNKMVESALQPKTLHEPDLDHVENSFDALQTCVEEQPRKGLLKGKEEQFVSADKFKSCVCSSEELRKLHELQTEMVAKKLVIMKKIEMETDKSSLNEDIISLQKLQKQYIIMEQNILMETLGNQNNKDTLVKEIGTHENISSLTYENDINDSCQQTNMTRSCASELESTGTEHITIPNYVMRGAGKLTHFEYEVRIVLEDGSLNVLRRYSRFRELHLSMKNCYGAKVGALPFPRREVFSSNSESVAKHRRRFLELYLRRLLVLCSKIPQSPIYEGPGGPGITRTTLAQLSPFFKKGLFENGKHGTG